MFDVGLVLRIVCIWITVRNCFANEYWNTSFTRIPRDTTGKWCVLPPQPRFGEWSIYEGTGHYFPGDRVPERTVLQVSCRNNYALDGDATMICLSGNWSKQIGKCLQTCPPRYSTSVMTVTCTKNNRKLETCDKATDGTKAKFQCADFYEDQGLSRHPIHLCYNGKWSHNLPECVPICGQKSTKEDPTLIVGGSNATKGDYPWQVALYNVTDKDLLCGGSLLNQRVVLTAAHCVTNSAGKILSKENYMIAVGKYYRKYDHPIDHDEAQFSPIHEIYIPKQYKGDIQNYFGDVAVIITKETFVLSLRVQPVCVDWGFHHHQALLDPVRLPHGYVTGWGYTVEYKNPSNTLKELKVPLITDENCNKKIPDDYKRFLTDDKLCAGFLNAATAVCKGDSGGGLVTKYGNRYYIVAVVSLSPQAETQEGGCDSQQYALYTRVSYYIDNFILELEARFRPSLVNGDVDCENDPNCKTADSTVAPTSTTTTTETTVTEAPRQNCVLPEHPIFGRWTIFGINSQFVPGNAVAVGTILQVSCNNDYHLSGSKTIYCENNGWAQEIPECLRSCPPIENTKTLEFTCSFKNKELSDCSNPLDGTIVKHKCAPFYEDLQLAKNPVRVCRNGSWDMTKPECVPICGLKSVTPQPLIINGNTVNRGEYPWHVGIYHGDKKQFICGGTLISQKLIITAAHCVTDWRSKVQSKTKYSVAVGKYYREYDNVLDTEAQFSKLQDIFLPLDYVRNTNNFEGDIALLVTERTFTLSKSVQPACVDWALNYPDDTKTSGYISGWGFTTPNSSPADTLQDLEIPIISNEKCRESLSQDFLVYLTRNRLCGGYLNKSTSTCSGDGGEGLVTKHDGRYYITGIVIISPSTADRACDSNQYTIFTKISAYNNFLLEKDAQIKSVLSTASDCRNGDSCQTTPKPSTEPIEYKSTCTLPQHPAFGKWSLVGTSSTKHSPGASVALSTVIKITCYKSYKLEGDSVLLCENGQWSSKIGKCLKMCPPVYSSSTVKAICINDGQESENCTEPVDGTRVKYECAPFYESPQLSQNPIHLCQDGNWNHKPPQCAPVCGQKSVNAQILIINGNNAKKGDYPWHVGVYQGSKKDFLCGGTLISQRIVLTAAMCVTRINGKPKSKDLYTVAAGKYYRKFDDRRDKTSDVQTSTLEDIVVHPRYKGASQNFFGNIAILVTTKPFVFSSRVQPVCVDWSMKHYQEFNTAGTNRKGYVTGWGFTTKNDKPSDELKELEVPVVPYEQCFEQFPEDFLSFLTSDKFCAGYRNEGKAVCKGDAGEALVTKFNGRYYITGINDIVPTELGDCNSNQYALYVKVSTYTEDFILPKVMQYQ